MGLIIYCLKSAEDFIYNVSLQLKSSKLDLKLITHSVP